MGSREILTLQLGNYSNYVGAHWWNIQESYFEYDRKDPSEICHDVLFREGKNFQEEITFTPRLIFLDKAENIVNVPILSETLINSENIFNENVEKLSVEEHPISEKHEFIQDLEKLEEGMAVDITNKEYNFNETVRCWTDFLRTKYHPKSVCNFKNTFSTNIFHYGNDIYKCLENDFVEKVRNYIEECDNLQGFQVIVDAGEAFGGFANSALIHIQDEYSGKCVFTLPVIPGYFFNTAPLEDIKRTINIFLSYQKLTENSNLLVPIGTNSSAWKALGPPIDFPNLIYDHRSAYQTSALLASFLDTATISYRLRERYCHMYDIVSGLNYYNNKICAASMSLPFPVSPESYLTDTLENLDDSLPFWSSLTPGCSISDDAILYQKITIRGISHFKLKNPNVSYQNSKAYSCNSPEELIYLYLSYRLNTISDVVSAKLPLKTVIPYPQIFSHNVTPLGGVDKNGRRMESFRVTSCPTLSGLHCCKSINQMLDSLLKNIKTINIKKFQQFFGSHMDMDEFNECVEKFICLQTDSSYDVL